MLSFENLPTEFRPVDLHSEDLALRVTSWDQVIAAASKWRGTLLTLLADVTRQRDKAIEEERQHPSPHLQDRVVELDTCIEQIHEGVYTTNEPLDPLIEIILYQPGLARTRAFLKDAKAAREAATRLRDEPSVTQKYRLKVGKMFKAGPDGQLIRYVVGDIVELNPSQARSFRDKFEPLDGNTKIEPLVDDDEDDIEDDDADEPEATTKAPAKRRTRRR
jgi:hypothetical protein